MKRRRLIAFFLVLALALSVPAAAYGSREEYYSRPYLRLSRLEFIGLLAHSLFPGRESRALGRPEFFQALGLTGRELASREFMTGEITRQEAARYLTNALRLRGGGADMKHAGFSDIAAVHPGWGLHRNEAAKLLRRFDGAAESGVVFEDFLFLGDSLTSNPHYESNIFQKNGHQVFAGGGAVVRNFLGLTAKKVTVGYVGAMTDTLRDKEFNGIVILLGANDVGKDEPEDTMVTYRKLLEELQEFCDKPIFVLRIFPINSGYAYGSKRIRREHADALNELLREYCEETDGIWFADPTGPFTDEDGLLLREKGTADGLHISSLYYEEFYEAIENALYGTGVVERRCET